MLLLRNKDPQ